MTKTTVILPDPIAKTLKILAASDFENMRSQSAIVTKALEEFFRTRGVPISPEKSLGSDYWFNSHKNIPYASEKPEVSRVDSIEKSRVKIDTILPEVEKAAETVLGRKPTKEEKVLATCVIAVLMGWKADELLNRTPVSE